jgi:hypothetical protein
MLMVMPRIGAVLAVLAVAALPATAQAQTADDTTPPVITVVTPADGTPTYEVGDPVQASYSCADAESPVTECAGPVASGAAIDTSQAGDFTFTVTSTNAAGLRSAVSRPYKVVVSDSDPGDVGGGAPVTLTLTLGQAGAFAPFIPGVANTYSATLSATMTSTAADALLTVADPATASPGHLVNGAFVLPQALKASATSLNGTSAPEAEVGDAAHPTSLLTYVRPFTKEQVTLTFKQAIGTTDALRTGAYGKSLTFTLSTTNP